MKQNRTWIVVADGAEARILQHNVGTAELQQLPSEEFYDFAAPTRDLVSERLPRVQDSAGPGRHGVEPRSDPHEQQKVGFITRLIEHLETAAKHHEFERLIVVAPPRALAVFRKCYSDRLKHLVQHELPHDYTHQTSNYIYQHMRDFI